jgi:hypothetical protein
MIVLRRVGTTALLLQLLACSAEDVPDSPTPVDVPERVSVTVTYRQPNDCANVTNPCSGDVVFYGSWMPRGGEVTLRAQPGSFVWTGTMPGVPVNYPPDDDPYFVRIYDPFLVDTPTAGRSGRRIELGGQALYVLSDVDTPTESARVYVDANGVGRNPF